MQTALCMLSLLTSSCEINFQTIFHCSYLHLGFCIRWVFLCHVLNATMSHSFLKESQGKRGASGHGFHFEALWFRFELKWKEVQGVPLIFCHQFCELEHLSVLISCQHPLPLRPNLPGSLVTERHFSAVDVP